MKRYLIVACIFLLHGKVHSQYIKAPVDHHHPDKGNFELYYEFGAPYKPHLPTVIVIADAQQFYVVKGRLKKIQEELFGDRFNVLGIVTRGNAKELTQKVINRADNKVDWQLAYTIFQSFQYVNDIELVRTKVLTDQKEVYLYGQSGGAFLITEYLSVFPNASIKKVFVGASVNPAVESKLGIVHDNFKRDFLSENPVARERLDKVVSENFFDRKLVARLFQRQNFFVKLSDLNVARMELTNRLINRDTTYINQLKKSYQIDALAQLEKTDIGIPIKIRIFEFIAPLLKSWKVNECFCYPDLENSSNMAYPLIELFDKTETDFHPLFDSKKSRNFQGKVVVLAGRYDHVADYRSSIYLSSLFENGYLFIADDDHTFKSLKSDNNYANLIQDFFLSNSNWEWIRKYDQYRWRED